MNILVCLCATVLSVAITPIIVRAILRRRRPPKSFLDDAARWRAVQFKRNKKKCENYSPDNSKFGVSCISPWCDYCSFFCERKRVDADDPAIDQMRYHQPTFSSRRKEKRHGRAQVAQERLRLR